jgi:predicted transcriptional regulator
MLIGKNTQPNMKYNLLIVNLIKELSSKMKANKEIINETTDSIQIQIIILTKNKNIFHSQNRGKLHKNINIIHQDMTEIINIFSKFLKNH